MTSIGNYMNHIGHQVISYWQGTSELELIWLIIGISGQCLFMMRFIVQWIHSERHGESIIPISFWYLSLIGGLTVLAYGIHKSEPVIILGQLPGAVVYARNLILIKRKKDSRIA